MGLNKIISRLASLAMLLGVFAFTGCGNVFEGRTDESGYGLLLIGGSSSSDCSDSSANPMRALSVGDVKTAVATVSGYGMTSVSSEKTLVSGGKGTVQVLKIPVGKNRIITVQGYSDSSATSEVEEAVLRAVVDIKSGVNTIDEINWTTSRKGYVYNALLEDKVDISSLTETQVSAIDNAIPEVDATNINLPLFVSDFAKGSGTLQDSSAYILASGKTLKRLVVAESSGSSESSPAFVATAYYSDGTNADVSGDSGTVWTSSKTSVATVSGGKVTLVSAGDTVVSASYTYGDVTKTGAKQTITVKASGGTIDKLYFTIKDVQWSQASPRYAAYFFNSETDVVWVNMTLDSSTGYYVCSKPAKTYATVIFCRMNPSTTENNWDNKWNQTADLTVPIDSDTYKYDDSVWDKGSGEWLSTLSGSYSGGTLTATIVSEVVTEPLPPTVTIAPASGTVSTSGTITVSYAENNATVTSASVTVSGAVSKSYSLSDFTGGKLSVKVSDLGITEEGKAINVSASVTNSEGNGTATASLTTVAKAQVADTFTWDNANVYFVLTDRFYNGDTKNDHSYYRKNGLSGDENVATFHGGDIAGLTAKLDYLDKLGVNAIWITAPYEQMHGWCSGKDNKFPHYSFHGYYTQDWTYMDQNMGTIDEFRTFVNEAHNRGIRVVMDVVMNHTAYNTVEDMITYNFGNFNTTPEHGWLGSGTWNDNHTITNYSAQGNWGNWWGCWVRAFNDQSWYSAAGYAPKGNGDITGSLSGLPDVVTERTASVSIPTFLKTKWTAETDSTTVPASTGNTLGNKYGDYKLPTVGNVDWYNKTGDWRTDSKGAPTDYQVIWLSGWVREFGIDGFRCDTAKHIDMYRWGQLKEACQSALEAWRKDSSKLDDSGAKDWDESFWMTGECFGWTSTAGSGDYYTTGKFDSMINFSFNGSAGSGTSSNYPSESTWSSYLSINNNADSDSNGNRNNVLTYVSSHDTRLCRAGDQKAVGTMLQLTPGGVQIYYGDENSRALAYTGCGDTDMMTRGDMDFTSNTDCIAHWGKVGTFRKYNPAVGAGTGSATKRTYNGSAGESKVAIGINGSSVDVSGLFDNGTTVYNWYDGKSATVSGGSVSFSGGSQAQPILVSDRNPADYGVTF